MMKFKDYQNFHQMLRETVEAHPGQTAYRWFMEQGQPATVTWEAFYAQVRAVSKSLMALGIKKDDKVNILSHTCYKWVLCDVGMMTIGACTVGIYQSNLAKDCGHIINHSDSVIIFVEDEKQLGKILEIRQDLPNISKVVLFNGRHAADDKWIITFEEFLSLGKDISDEAFQERTDGVEPLDSAGIVYTSGTTGIPKGAVLTHDNILFTAQSVLFCVDVREGDDMLLFLPLAHVFARTCAYTALMTATTTTFARSMDTLMDDFKAARPHWFVSVPRIFEKVHSKVLDSAETKRGLALKIFRWACEIGKQVSDYESGKQPVPFHVRVQHHIATLLIFKKIQAALGGRVRWCICGAAPLNPDIARFFHGAGILILEGLGMSENTSFSNVNHVNHYRFGWVGPPGPGIEQKIADDGEIMFRGRNVMKEYYKMPEETHDTINPDGWLLSGDIGETDSEEFLRITGRKKEIIITAGGKNIAPAAIEGAFVTCKYVSHICVIGDTRKYLTALVSLDPENISEYARENDISFHEVDDLLKNKSIIRLVESEVAEKNKSFASYETIKKIALVPEFTIKNGLMTSTLKLRKNMIIDHYEEEINAMYPDS